MKFIDDNGYTRDEYEVAALKYKNNDIDIYSCSFGTTDNAGFSTKSMTPIEDALAEGVSMVIVDLVKIKMKNKVKFAEKIFTMMIFCFYETFPFFLFSLEIYLVEIHHHFS